MNVENLNVGKNKVDPFRVERHIFRYYDDAKLKNFRLRRLVNFFDDIFSFAQ